VGLSWISSFTLSVSPVETATWSDGPRKGEEMVWN
jgi:hypothetical protein